MARLYLVRHGTHALVGKTLAGRMPGVTLSAEGTAQAEALAGHFADVEIGTIVSSPMERCQQTAAPIAARLGLPVGIDEALTEIDCGEWTGQSFDALRSDTRWHAWNAERGRTTIPGGESAAAVCSRAMALVNRLGARDGAPVILVSHSDVIKFVTLALLRADLDLHDRLAIDPASITTLDLWDGGGTLVRSNQVVPA